MSERSLERFNPSAWTYEDQEQALTQGFNSVTEWGLWRVVTEIIPALEARIEALESGTEVEVVDDSAE